MESPIRATSLHAAWPSRWLIGRGICSYHRTAVAHGHAPARIFQLRAVSLSIRLDEARMITAKQYGPWAFIAGGSEGVAASFARQLAGVGINLVLVAPRTQTIAKL